MPTERRITRRECPQSGVSRVMNLWGRVGFGLIFREENTQFLTSRYQLAGSDGRTALRREGNANLTACRPGNKWGIPALMCLPYSLHRSNPVCGQKDNCNN